MVGIIEDGRGLEGWRKEAGCLRGRVEGGGSLEKGDGRIGDCESRWKLEGGKEQERELEAE